MVTGSSSYRGIRTFLDVQRLRLNAAFGLAWNKAPAHTAIRYILQGLDPAAVERVFRQHAAGLNAAHQGPEPGRIALDGKTLRRSFDNFKDRKAAQVLSAPGSQRSRFSALQVLSAPGSQRSRFSALLRSTPPACWPMSRSMTSRTRSPRPRNS